MVPGCKTEGDNGSSKNATNSNERYDDTVGKQYQWYKKIMWNSS